MKVTTEQLEEILDNLVSKKSREKFFIEYFGNADSETVTTKVNNIPEQYINELLEIKLPEETYGSKDNTGRLNRLTCALALAAEKAGRHEQAANLYKKLGYTPTAVAQARLAGLDELANKWADEYINGSFQEKPIGSFDMKENVEAAIKRAHNVGMTDKAKNIARKFVGNLDEHLRENPDDPELFEEKADFAAKYELAEEAESFYRTAMTQFEEKGEYSCALRVARKLNDSEKIEFYDNLRHIVADPERRKQIAQDRIDDADGKEFERIDDADVREFEDESQ